MNVERDFVARARVSPSAIDAGLVVVLGETEAANGSPSSPCGIRKCKCPGDACKAARRQLPAS
jgi:hypothetical protein